MTTSEFIKTANELGLENKANVRTKGLQFLRGMLDVPVGFLEANWRAVAASAVAGGLLGAATGGLSNLLPGASSRNLKNKENKEDSE
jgi:hypothetical protein